MKVVIHASHVAIEEMDDLFLVGFADDKLNTRAYFTLQRSMEEDEQNIRLGMNTYHVERNDQAWSGYGGIRALELKRDRVKVSFTKEGAVQIGYVTDMEITFQIGLSEFATLRDCLGRIFAGTGCLVE